MFTLNRQPAAKPLLAFASPRNTYKILLVLRFLPKLFYSIFLLSFVLAQKKQKVKTKRLQPHRHVGTAFRPVHAVPKFVIICINTTVAVQQQVKALPVIFCNYCVCFSKWGWLMLTGRLAQR